MNDINELIERCAEIAVEVGALKGENKILREMNERYWLHIKNCANKIEPFSVSESNAGREL